MCLPLCVGEQNCPDCRFIILYLDAQNMINLDIKSAPLAHSDLSDSKHWTCIWKSRFVSFSLLFMGLNLWILFKMIFFFFSIDIWLASSVALSYVRAWFFSDGMWLHPRRRGSGKALAVCTDGLLRAVTCLFGLCGGMADRVHREKTGDGLGAGGCKCRADNTACCQSHTRQEEGRAGQRCLNTSLETKKLVLGENTNFTLGKFSFRIQLPRSVTSASACMVFIWLIKVGF